MHACVCLSVVCLPVCLPVGMSAGPSVCAVFDCVFACLAISQFFSMCLLVVYRFVFRSVCRLCLRRSRTGGSSIFCCSRIRQVRARQTTRAACTIDQRNARSTPVDSQELSLPNELTYSSCKCLAICAILGGTPLLVSDVATRFKCAESHCSSAGRCSSMTCFNKHVQQVIK